MYVLREEARCSSSYLPSRLCQQSCACVRFLPTARRREWVHLAIDSWQIHYLPSVTRFHAPRKGTCWTRHHELQTDVWVTWPCQQRHVILLLSCDPVSTVRWPWCQSYLPFPSHLLNYQGSNRQTCESERERNKNKQINLHKLAGQPLPVSWPYPWQVRVLSSLCRVMLSSDM